MQKFASPIMRVQENSPIILQSYLQPPLFAIPDIPKLPENQANI
jgi:hypothetical protein